jgi:hypothetical protein
MMVWWGLWFRNTSPPSNLARRKLLAVLVVSIAAIAVGRLLALTLPFRDRPIHSERGQIYKSVPVHTRYCLYAIALLLVETGKRLRRGGLMFG